MYYTATNSEKYSLVSFIYINIFECQFIFTVFQVWFLTLKLLKLFILENSSVVVCYDNNKNRTNL